VFSRDAITPPRGLAVTMRKARFSPFSVREERKSGVPRLEKRFARCRSGNYLAETADERGARLTLSALSRPSNLLIRFIERYDLEAHLRGYPTRASDCCFLLNRDIRWSIIITAPIQLTSRSFATLEMKIKHVTRR